MRQKVLLLTRQREMKLYNVTLLIPLMASLTEGFSMLSPRFSSTFDKYLREMDELFERDWPSSLMEKHLKQIEGTVGEDKAMTFYRASPKYSVLHDHDKFEVKIEVPGYKPEEINVGLRAGGRMLTVSGHHKEERDNSSMSSKFQQNFSLDPSILINEIKADLVGSTLLVSAPRKADLLLVNRSIPVNMVASGDEPIPITEHSKVEQKVTEEKKEAAAALKP
jgi:HSP20 family molecular chaperone IbpA